ncbi:MAG TPA: TrkA C-terminal domain-containing protein [Pseudobacteroides sp.]|uniref:cation:proton antiporter regulatory subunit n=1 Tax=Pseudobacteroides sp. TaxID=1968840 RepID=UPI002F921CE0
MSFFSETNLPGIGKKINCVTHSKEKVSLILHNDGKRELYIMDKNNEPLAGISLLDEEARRFGAFLSGEVFKPKSLESLEIAMEKIKIDWFRLESDSPVIGKRIGGLGLRKKTQVSIIAILKEDTYITNPSSDYIFTEGDTCVVLGDPKNFPEFLNIIRA